MVLSLILKQKTGRLIKVQKWKYLVVKKEIGYGKGKIKKECE